MFSRCWTISPSLSACEVLIPFMCEGATPIHKGRALSEFSSRYHHITDRSATYKPSTYYHHQDPSLVSLIFLYIASCVSYKIFTPNFVCVCMHACVWRPKDNFRYHSLGTKHFDFICIVFAGIHVYVGVFVCACAYPCEGPSTLPVLFSWDTGLPLFKSFF